MLKLEPVAHKMLIYLEFKIIKCKLKLKTRTQNTWLVVVSNRRETVNATRTNRKETLKKIAEKSSAKS